MYPIISYIRNLLYITNYIMKGTLYMYFHFKDCPFCLEMA